MLPSSTSSLQTFACYHDSQFLRLMRVHDLPLTALVFELSACFFSTRSDRSLGDYEEHNHFWAYRSIAVIESVTNITVA